MLTATAPDGTSVRAIDEGQGPVILILHPGLETGQRYAKIAGILARRFRVVRLHRRQYRLDLKADPRRGSPCTIAQEVEHALALVRSLEAAGAGPIVLYGHSSGATLALETLVAAPSSFVGGLVYEPASVIGAPGEERLCGDRVVDGEGVELRRCRAALAAGRPGLALAIFTTVAAGWPMWQARPAGAVAALVPGIRRLIPCQIDDLDALEHLGVRLDAYAGIHVPVAMMNGGRSPAMLKEIVDAMMAVLPSAERVVLEGAGHDGHVNAPELLAKTIEAHADRVLSDRA